MHIDPLTEAVAAEITDIDLSSPLDENSTAKIKMALHQFGVLVFHGQSMDEEQLLAFSRGFGPLEIHVATEYNMREHPEIILLSNKVVDGRPVGIQEAGRFWHSDLSYMQKPSMGSIIYALDMPPVEAGGNTLYAGMHSAYDALEAGLKKQLEGLHAVHDYTHRVYLDAQEGRQRMDVDEDLKKRTTAIHPLVRVHPETGRKVLFVNEGFTTEIVDMPKDESRDLLAQLFAHQARPEFSYTHKWSNFDIVMWDNITVIHKATWFDPSYTRHAYRTTVAGA